MNRDQFECVPVAIRVHTTTEPAPDENDGKTRRNRPSPPTGALPRRTLVFDCETTVDETQRLLFGVWRLYIDGQDNEPARVCVEEGIFHDDDLQRRDPAGFDQLRRYVRLHRADVSPGYRSRLKILTRTEFVHLLIWKVGYRQQATIVGFNLPFDLSRLALNVTSARGENRDGLSLRLWEHNGDEHPYRPRITLRAFDAQRTMIQFTGKFEGIGDNGRPVKGHTFRGRFLDLRTLAFAHTDRRGLSLEHACERFGVDYTKRDVEHGTITADYITYCREDVDATSRLYRATRIEHRRHPIKLSARDTYSAATIGKSYWKALGITAYAERDVWLDPEVAGWGMSAFYGGRAECRIRKVDVPVVYCDFVSMYQTCNALMHTWTLVIADHLTVNDNTAEIRRLLERDDIRDLCFDPATWPLLHTLVELEPNGATLPVRAKYDNHSWRLGLNPFHSNRTCWYPLADVLAARLLGGPAPIVVRSFRIGASDVHPNLNLTRLLGEIELNPKRADFFATTVEQRHHVRTRADFTADQRTRIGQFLKVLANATGFGILAQYDRKNEPKPITVTVHTDREPFTIRTKTPDLPAAYTTPPLAACVTSAARLMLALLEHDLTEAGGTYAFCDTDSMAIVATRHGGDLIECPGGTDATQEGQPAIRALSWPDVNRLIDAFAALNPYSSEAVPGSILRIETENYDDDTRHQRELRCYAISAKRYQLTTVDGQQIKCSEHGLGHLQNPAPASNWIQQAWQHITNPDTVEPDWLDLPALSKITVTSPEAHAWFRRLNNDKPYSDQIKPWNFLNLAHPDPLDPNGAQPVAPYNPNPDQWADLAWIDRNTGQPVRVTTRPLDGHHQPGTTRVRTYRDTLTAYHHHPDTSALAPDHTPITGTTRGLLQRRPVQALPTITYIGKESHDLDNRAHGITDNTDAVNEYHPRQDDWHTIIVPALRTLRSTDIVRDTGINIRTVQRALSAKANVPRERDRQRLTDHITAHARAQVPNTKRTDDHRNVLYRYLQFANHANNCITPAHDTENK